MKKQPNQWLWKGPQVGIVCSLFLFTLQLKAQNNLNVDGTVNTVPYSGHYVDYIIPATTTYNAIFLEALGGDGGDATNRGPDGGRGAKVQGYLMVGNDAIPAGSTIRFIVGQQGESSGDFGGGGGGTAIAIKKKNESSWTLLMVAGAGGGAGLDRDGREAETGTSGSGGEMNWNAGSGDTMDNGGTNGNGGGGTSQGGAGGGAFGAGDNGKNSEQGQAGYQNGVPTGGAGGQGVQNTDLANGGWGFGGGGMGHHSKNSSIHVGGAGGGYSGGGASQDDGGGGGGGSYAARKFFVHLQMTKRGTGSSPKDGSITYKFVNFPTYVIKGSDHQEYCITTYTSSTGNGENLIKVGCNTSGQHFEWVYANFRFRLKDNPTKCMDQDTDPMNYGTNIHLWDCSDSDNQKWIYDGLGGVIRSISHPEKCLKETLRNVELTDCVGSADQQWTIAGAGRSSLKNRVGKIRLAAHVDKCIDNAGGSTANKNNIQLWDCEDGNENQEWYFNGVEIRLNAHWNKCLDLLDNKTDNGQNIQLYGCSSWDNQKWLYDGFTKQFRSKKDPDKCLDLSKGDTGNGGNIQIWDCMPGNPNQQWTVDSKGLTSGNTGTIRVYYQQDKCIDNSAGSTENNNNIQLWDCQEGNQNQVWNYDGNSIRLNQNREKCLDLDGSNTTNGRNIQLFDCNGTDAQNWIYDAATRTFRSKIDLNKCLDMTNGVPVGFARGTNIQLYDCVDGHPNQQFILN